MYTSVDKTQDFLALSKLFDYNTITMQFVEKHLTHHHLFHAPHRWFFALLLSPIHAAELHYKHKYYLTFRHAKKLFFFDMCLLASIIVLTAGTLFYFFYDPTIRDLIFLKVEHSTERIKTGDKIVYKIEYANNSDVSVESSSLSFEFPKGFIPEKFEPNLPYKPENSTIELGTLAPGGHGSINVSGILYGSPDQEYPTTIKLSYIPEKTTNREFLISRIFTAPRETPLLVKWQSSDYALSSGDLPFQIQVENKGTQKLDTLKIPLPTANGITFENINATQGTMMGNTWTIPTLLSKTSSTLSGNMRTQLGAQTKNIIIEITPSISANNTEFAQKKISKNIEIVHPNIVMSSAWKNNIENVRPYESATLEITLRNDSTLDMNDLVLNIPLANPIDLSNFPKKNLGILRNNIFTIQKIHRPELATLKSGETKSILLQVPFTHPTQGTDIAVSFNIELLSHISQLPQQTIFTKKIKSPEIKIASRLLLGGQVLYYTPEGDQLGRGPLPPRVDSETKYWATLSIQNTTSKVENIEFSATVPSYVAWTDKSSVSIGRDVTFDEQTRKISWTHPSVPPHTTVGINFELAITPTTAQKNTTPIILQNIVAQARDSFTEIPLSATFKALDISLPFDSIGKQRGVMVTD